MNKEKLKLWLDALRSGEYQQGKGRLAIIDKETGDMRYCCLGVACEVAIKDGLDLLRDIGLGNIDYGLAHDSGFLPEEVQQWLELDDNNVFVDFTDSDGNNRDERVAYLNDTQGWTFEQIADALEAKYLAEETA